MSWNAMGRLDFTRTHVDGDYVEAEMMRALRKLARKSARGARVETKKDKRGHAVRIFCHVNDAPAFRAILADCLTTCRIIW